MNTVIVGATGLIGSAISAAMVESGTEVTALVRDASRVESQLPAEVKRIVFSDSDEAGVEWKSSIARADVVINLAGEPIGGQRWNGAVKEKLLQSRVDTTRRIVDVLIAANTSNPRYRKLVNASAVGYYGDCGDETVTEDRGPGSDFLADLCVRWEAEALQANSAGIQVTLMRLGPVLARSGMLQKMLYPLPFHISPFKLGLGGPLGSGKQWMSWIHIEDVVGLFLAAATNADVKGAINVTAPNPVTNREFARILGHVLHRPAVVPVPAFAMRAIVGEFAEALLTGQRAIPAAAQLLGYSFKYTNLEQALKHLI